VNSLLLHMLLPPWCSVKVHRAKQPGTSPSENRSLNKSFLHYAVYIRYFVTTVRKVIHPWSHR
jgi:hypothetical protein